MSTKGGRGENGLTPTRKTTLPDLSAVRWLGVTALLLARCLGAQDTTARVLPAVIVTRDRERWALDLPFGITTMRPDSVSPGQSHAQVDQTLAFVPGLTTANRSN